jgi:hypothetical protein
MPALPFSDGNRQPAQQTIGRARHRTSFVFLDGWRDIHAFGSIGHLDDYADAPIRSVIERGEHAEAATFPGRERARTHEDDLRRKNSDQQHWRQQAQWHQWITTTRYPPPTH